MDRNEIVWILECCLLNLDHLTKADMISFGCPEELADMGIQICDYLKNKNIVVGLKNGYQ